MAAAAILRRSLIACIDRCAEILWELVSSAGTILSDSLVFSTEDFGNGFPSMVACHICVEDKMKSFRLDGN